MVSFCVDFVLTILDAFPGVRFKMLSWKGFNPFDDNMVIDVSLEDETSVWALTGKHLTYVLKEVVIFSL